MMTAGVPIENKIRPVWTNADDKYSGIVSNRWGKAVRYDTTEYTGNQVTLWRWREDFQNDFAARMDWCSKSYKEANHPPAAKVNGPDQFTVKSGQIF